MVGGGIWVVIEVMWIKVKHRQSGRKILRSTKVNDVLLLHH